MKTFLVYDFGESVNHALALAEGGKNKVLYYTPWASSSCVFEDYAYGLGFEKEGLEKVLYFFESIPKADVIVFFTIGAGDLCTYLRETTGKPIFGAGKMGEKLENHRQLLRQLQEELGLPTQKTTIVKGIENLREYITKNPDKYVKIDIFRGDVETFPAKNIDSIGQYLNELQSVFGAFADQYEFLVEEKIDGVEVGFDMFFNKDDWVKPMLWGYEVAKNGYLGKFEYNKLPPPLQLIADKLKTFLSKIDYRGGCSIECLVTKDGTPYLTDICGRYPFPLSNLYPTAIKNYSELIEKVAKGEKVGIKTPYKYVSSLCFSSPHLKEYYTEVDFDSRLKDLIKVPYPAKVDGKFYGVKKNNFIAMVVAGGSDVESVIKKIKKEAELVDAFDIEKSSLGQLTNVQDVINKGKEVGIDF